MKNAVILILFFLFAGNDLMAQNRQYRKEIKKGEKALKKDNTDKAAQHFMTAYKLSDGEIEPLYLLGLTYKRICMRDNMECPLAIGFLTQVINQDSFYRDAIFERSQAHLRNKLFGEAYYDLQLITEKLGDNEDFTLHRARVYREMGNIEAACVELQKLLSGNRWKELYLEEDCP